MSAESNSNFNSSLESANQALKPLRVSLIVKGSRIYVQATLPPKPGCKHSKPKQQQVATWQQVSKAGIRAATSMAKRIALQRDEGEFEWKNWANLRHKPKENYSTADWIESFREDWEARSMRHPKTWRHEYGECFSHLAQELPLGEKDFLRVVRLSEPDTRKRMRYCTALNALARFAKSEIDVSAYRGSYGQSAVNPRDLPNDRQIVEWGDGIDLRQWQLAFGILATYGLRPSELAFLNFEQFPTLEVVEGKTGRRLVLPFYENWIVRWNLQEFAGVPQFTTNQLFKWFRRRGLPRPYVLRHCYARRLGVEFHMPPDIASRMMGHSIRVHQQTYKAWVDEADWLRAAQSFAANGPLAPTVKQPTQDTRTIDSNTG